MRMDPPVSVPRAATQAPAPTRAAEPPLEPPAVNAASTGLRASGRSGWGAPAAYSSRLVVAKTSAAPARSRTTAGASAGARGPGQSPGLPVAPGPPATLGSALVPPPHAPHRPF